MKKTYQGTQDKSKQKFEVIGKREMLVEVPLPMVEVWEELQAEVEQLTGQAGLRIISAILENEVTRRVGPSHQPGPESGAVRWGRQPGYVVFGGRKVAIERPRVRTRKGKEVELDSYARLQHDGRRQRAVREGIVAGLTSRNYRRAVQSVVEGYGIEKSSVSREFVAASAAQLQELCEKKLEGLDLVAILIDGIHLGKQVLVVALGIAISGRKHVLGLWQGATENTTVVKELLEDLVARGLDPRAALLVRDRRSESVAGGNRAGVWRAGRSAALPDSQTAKRERAFAEERAGRYRPENPQRLCDDRVRGGESGAGKDLPATGAHQSQRGAQLGGRAGGNPHGASAGRGQAVAANVGFDQSDRVLLFHRGKSGAQCETLAGRGPRVALDRHGAAGSGKEIPQGKRLSGTGNSAAQTESVVDSTGAGGVTCGKSRAAAFSFRFQLKAGQLP